MPSAVLSDLISVIGGPFFVVLSVVFPSPFAGPFLAECAIIWIPLAPFALILALLLFACVRHSKSR